MKILVCGGRSYGTRLLAGRAIPDFKARKFLEDVLHYLYVQHGFTHLIHGDAQGADKLAGTWAKGHGVQPVACAALWEWYGNSAGSRRNFDMLKLLAKGDIVVAFPGGRGTGDMVARARATGFRVIEVHPDADVPAEITSAELAKAQEEECEAGTDANPK